MKYHHTYASKVYTALSRLRSYTQGHHMAFVSQELLAETAGLEPRKVRMGIDTINTSPKYGFYITWNKREGHIFVKHDTDIERELKVIARDFERLNNRRKKLLYIQRRNGNQELPFTDDDFEKVELNPDYEALENVSYSKDVPDIADLKPMFDKDGYLKMKALDRKGNVIDFKDYLGEE